MRIREFTRQFRNLQFATRNSLISSHGWINFPCPGVDSAIQVEHIGPALLQKPGGYLCAPSTMVATDYNFGVFVLCFGWQCCQPFLCQFADWRHRNCRSGDTCSGKFMWLAYIQPHKLLTCFYFCINITRTNFWCAKGIGHRKISESPTLSIFSCLIIKQEKIERWRD